MSSPTQRSLKRLRQEGWTACVVEKRIPFRNITVDALGFGDILAVRVSISQVTFVHVREIALVQTTSGSNMAKRRTKIAGLDTPAKWKAAGGIILLHGWRKVGARGKRKTWQVAEERL